MVCIERLLEGRRSGDGIGGAGKDGEAAIALAPWPDHVPTMPHDDLLDQRVVADQGRPHGRRLLLPEASTALNVGEEKGDSARRQVGHRRPPSAQTMMASL